MSKRPKTLSYVLLQHKDHLKVYLEDPDLPVRVLPHDICVGRGELPLSDEVAEYVAISRTPAYKLPKGECTARLSEEAFHAMIELALGAGFASAEEWFHPQKNKKKRNT